MTYATWRINCPQIETKRMPTQIARRSVSTFGIAVAVIAANVPALAYPPRVPEARAVVDVACSPFSDPDVMRVSEAPRGKERLDDDKAQEAAQS